MISISGGLYNQIYLFQKEEPNRLEAKNRFIVVNYNNDKMLEMKSVLKLTAPDEISGRDGVRSSPRQLTADGAVYSIVCSF
jgi:hypothetical protein